MKTVESIIRQHYQLKRQLSEKEVLDELANVRRRKYKGTLDNVYEHIMASLEIHGHLPEPKVLTTGSWTTTRDCPHPRKGQTNGAHLMKEIASKPSPAKIGRKAGERIVTSQCYFCGALIIDCPGNTHFA